MSFCLKTLMIFYANVDDKEVRMSLLPLYKYNKLKWPVLPLRCCRNKVQNIKHPHEITFPSQIINNDELLLMHVP